MWTAPPIALTDKDRVELIRRVAAHKTPVRAARRARIILLAADGVPSRQISAVVGMHESNVAKWRNRFREKGLDGLEDAPRPGGPRRFGHDERMAMAAAVATSERDPDDPVATWSYLELAQQLWADGVQI
nr:helix-turn-helix domain-containing protein [Actinomycetota bacterium]